MAQRLSETSAKTVVAHWKTAVQSVRSCYTQTHDGLRLAKGTGKGRNITVGDLYAFSVAAGYCFDFFPKAERQAGTRGDMGAMAPTIQDCRKNLIKIVWKAAGHEVVDPGNTLEPQR